MVNISLFDSIRNFAKKSLKANSFRTCVFIIKENAILENYLNLEENPLPSVYFQIGVRAKLLRADHIILVKNTQRKKISIVENGGEDDFGISNWIIIWVLEFAASEIKMNLTEHFKRLSNFEFRNSETFLDDNTPVGNLLKNVILNGFLS